jgi:hypothetical protein
MMIEDDQLAVFAEIYGTDFISVESNLGDDDEDQHHET